MAGEADNPGTPPTPSSDPKPAPKPPAAPNPPNPQPKPAPEPAPVATLTIDQVKELLAEERRVWETEHVPKLREEIAASITTPMQADTLIRGLRHELQQAGVYLPKDDDNTDPDTPGELAALDPNDHAVVLRTNKDGTKYTKLNREINRLRTRLLAERKPRRAGADALSTPPLADDTPADVFEAIRKQTRDHDAAKADAHSKALARAMTLTS
jgi:hypothetical protein